MRREDLADADCGIAQTLGVVGDWQSLLILREAAAGVTRFDGFDRALGFSRRALSERLGALVEHDILRKEAYSTRPPRHDYVLTRRGESLLPVLVALQEWGTQHLLGDGEVSGASADAEVRRVHGLLGTTPPDVVLATHDGGTVHLRDPDRWTVAFFFPGAYAPESHSYPPGWSAVPGARGCTLETRTYASRHEALHDAGARVLGVSTQHPEQLAAFADFANLPYTLASDQDGRAASALRLPVFRAGGSDRLKRVTVLLDPAGTIRHLQAPITDPAGSVDDMLDTLRSATTAAD
ncbi:winged helix-turn-helix transcriptional regulator [Myceligenerans pegani]|uniref:Winged helix-turn-helix transcriptional regulator n=1 Tax=Myceligenerans pegani TaxID=2776917 RepID=A0ABR9N5B7_9MICO|nr:winged helix-turn-helix transcriptional regulator [Myceligenerans sp. TRM 65318]MBE1878273.1 winged helix-turn-helix transcriptional regulator [Myceligenerans sp. TRM 65318]MBE3020544.1 winged helix-turn-helix transcriptional regulator [Myceligenerans sp. TRM 65318]